MAEDPQFEPSELPQIVPMSLADQTRERSKRGSSSKPVAQGAFILAAIPFFALFLPFGFDHPSPAGLDFGHFLLALLLFAIFGVVGVVAAWSGRS